MEHTNSKNGGAIFNLSNKKPGDTLNGALTITNTGSLTRADRTVPGSGIGLATVRAAVEAHGGSVGVRPAQSGTTFWFVLPDPGDD